MPVTKKQAQDEAHRIWLDTHGKIASTRIATRVGVHVETVRRWVRRWEADAVALLEPHEYKKGRNVLFQDIFDELSEAVELLARRGDLDTGQVRDLAEALRALAETDRILRNK